MLSDDLTHAVHERCGTACSLVGVEGGLHCTRLHVYEHSGCGNSARHADSDGTLAPVAICVCRDEFTLGDTFQLRLLGVEVLERVCGAVGLPEEDVVEVHVASELCAVNVDADGVNLGKVREGELIVAVAEFDLVILEGSEVIDVTEADFLPVPAAGHVEERNACPAVFAAAIAGCVQARACGFACDSHVEGDGYVLAPALVDVDTHGACFARVGLYGLVNDVEGVVAVGDFWVFLDCRVDGIARNCGEVVSFTHGVEGFVIGDVADFTLILVGLAADNGEVAVTFVAGIPHARNEAVLLCCCDRVAVPSSASPQVGFKIVAGKFVETLDSAHFADHDRDALIVEASLEAAEELVDGFLGAESRA